MISFFLGDGLSVLADYRLLRVRVDFLHFLFDFIGRRAMILIPFCPFITFRSKLFFQAEKPATKGSVRLLHGDKDGVSEAVIMEF